jgi:hypothetical protein
VTYQETVFDDQGTDVRHVTASDGGFAPSTIVAFSTHALASGSTPERKSFYTGTGADGLPFTADDVLDSYVEITRDGRGNVTRLVRYQRPSGSASSAPIVVDSYTVSTYDAHDNLVQATIYTDPGPDGIWFTADDVVFGIYEYDTTH